MLRCRARLSVRRLLSAAASLVLLLAGPQFASADELDLRLRIAWGAQGESPARWFGRIDFADAEVSDLMPLGVERDAAVALRIEERSIIVEPLVDRSFDGCEATVRGDAQSVVTFELQTPQMEAPAVVRLTLAEIASSDLAPLRLNDAGGALLVRRRSDDRLRVELERDALVFAPGETFAFSITHDFAAGGESPIRFDVQVRSPQEEDPLWQSTAPSESDASGSMPFALPCPDREGVYRVVVTASRREAFPFRFAPGRQAAVLATREFEIVVVDPEARLPAPSDDWRQQLSIDPAHPSWRLKLPQLPPWTQVERIAGQRLPRPLGNVNPIVRSSPAGDLVELPGRGDGEEPAWQAYTLPLRDAGSLHSVELALPAGVAQNLAVSIVEPDAAGRVRSFGRASGFATSGEHDEASGTITQRFDFWPRTTSPVLLIANRGETPAQYGRIRVLRESRTAEADAGQSELESSGGSSTSSRRVTAYIASPRFPEAFAAPQTHDSATGLSIDSWETFLSGTRRLAQYLKRHGYDSAIVAVAADGSSLTPIDAFGVSPRYDTGMIAGVAADPVRKDVLEAMLRIFDREGLQLIPAIQLGGPVAALERLRRQADPVADGLQWVDLNGQTWSQRHPVDALAEPRYNLLHPKVQTELLGALGEFVGRYGQHPSYGGLALQVEGGQYGVLPGLLWGMSEATAARFTRETGVALPVGGGDAHLGRAKLLNETHLAAWKHWRAAQLTSFYRRAAEQLSEHRQDARLILCTESLLEGADAQHRVRQSLAGRFPMSDVLVEAGFDAAALAESAKLLVARPRRFIGGRPLQQRAIDDWLNASPELDAALRGQHASAELYYYGTQTLDLPSFDAQSPFGPERTRLTLQSPSIPVGPEARRSIVESWARRDPGELIIGSELPPFGIDQQLRRLTAIFRALPGADADVRKVCRQPVVARTYRQGDRTTICMINPSPWNVAVSTTLNAEDAVEWRALGADLQAVDSNGPPTSGKLSVGQHPWTATIEPFSVVAWEFSGGRLRTGGMNVEVDPKARDQLAQRMVEIELRLNNINFQRLSEALRNPGFEEEADDGLIPGWQAMIGRAGAVELRDEAPHAGRRALYLKSDDNAGVAVQSELFDIPETGQLTVRCPVRFRNCGAHTLLYARLHHETSAGWQDRWIIARPGDFAEGKWESLEVSSDELPIGDASQMRLILQLVGPGEAWVDDIEMFDFRLADSQRVDFGRRFYAANNALRADRLSDCLELVDGYWQQYLVEFVPVQPTVVPSESSPPISVAARTPTAPVVDLTHEEKKDAEGLGGRMRRWVPSFFR